MFLFSMAATLRRISRIVPPFLLLQTLIGGSLACGQSRGGTEPVPSDAVPAILQRFDNFPVVAIGDNHGCPELHAFLIRLLQAPQFADKVNMIVVEFGNSLYQNVADDYVVEGKEVPTDQLVRVWRDTVGGTLAFDSPVYDRFFAAVRELNLRRPRQKRIRILLGDPPIDWSKTTTKLEWGRILYRRDSHFADVVEHEVFERGLRALLVIGGAHLVRGIGEGNVTARIESKHPGTMFVIIPHSGFHRQNEELEVRLASWKAPALAVLKGTWLGALHPGLRWAQMSAAKFYAPERASETPRLEDVADAWLFVGLRDGLTEEMPWPGIYRDDYWQELNRRFQIMWGRPMQPDDFNTKARYYVP